ncbi:MAG: S8 family peptidase [Bacteroidota bacterium]|nr:S8 family peptidase [Candidatus Kapabacteria bacterium]MDW8220256.1 S8 family peptidase [Bacteroidota bacterium]
MRKNYTLLCLLLTTSIIAASAQSLYSQQYVSATSSTYRIFFRDKGTEEFRKGSALYARTQALLSPRALARRSKLLPPEQLLTLADAPIFEPYLDSVRRSGATILLTVRWNNYALVTCSTVQIEHIRHFPFVRAVQPARERLLAMRQVREEDDHFSSAAERALYHLSVEHYAVHHSASMTNNCGTLLYGNAYHQLHTIGITDAHTIGIAGQGVIIGVIDTGFRWRAQRSLQHASVLAEYDFIQNDSVTANQSKPWIPDQPDQDDHGTKVLSVMASYAPNALIGGAFRAHYLLAKTEDLRYERHIEQDNAAAALEWLEAQGADIVNLSLGYMTFDQPDESYTYNELDGKTSILSRAVNEASRRGVLCVVAAGNDGRRGWRTLSTPADADSALSVAALRLHGTVATSFSSRGPRADGALKPDIAAQGDSVIVAAPTGREYQYASGTSFATPLITAGAALILSAFPEFSSSDIRQLLLSTASQATTPDTVVGYGRASIIAALRKAGTVLAPDIISYPLWNVQRVGASILPHGVSIRAHLFLRMQGEQQFSSFELRPAPPHPLYFVDIPFSRFSGKAAECYVIVQDGRTTRRIPQEGTYTLIPQRASIPCGIPALSLPIEKPSIVQEGIIPSPISSDREFATLLISTPEPSMLEYTVYSMYGSPVANSAIPVNPGISTIPFPVSRYGRGVYFVQVRYNGTIQIFKFIVN